MVREIDRPEEAQPQENQDQPITRRDFLKGIGFLGAGAGLRSKGLGFDTIAGRPQDADPSLDAIGRLNPQALKIVPREDQWGQKVYDVVFTTSAKSEFSAGVIQGTDSGNYLHVTIPSISRSDANIFERLLTHDYVPTESEVEKIMKAGATSGGLLGAGFSRLVGSHGRGTGIWVGGGAAVGAAVAVAGAYSFGPKEWRDTFSRNFWDTISRFWAGNKQTTKDGASPPSVPNPPTVPTPPVGQTPEIIVKPVEDPEIFAASDWAAYKEGAEKGKPNPEMMFPIVGSVDHRNRRVLDVGTFGTLKDNMRIAVDTGQDLTKVTDAKKIALMREKAVEVYEKDKEFADRLRSIQSQFKTQYGNFKDASLTVVLGVNEGKNGNGEDVVRNHIIVQYTDSQGLPVLTRFYLEKQADGFKLKELKDYNFLPQLRVEGPYILRTDQLAEGEDGRIQFKGVTIYTFYQRNQSFRDAKKYIDIAKSWGSNLLRFQLDTAYLNLNELEKTIQYAEQNGMYVILTPANNSGKQITRPTDQTGDFIFNLAQRFSSRKNIFYGLINEIGDEKDDNWYHILINQAKDFRSKYSDPILIMSGWRFNRDFSIVQKTSFPDKNTIFDVHYYSPPPGWSNNFEFLRGQVPILFGEAGARQPYRDDPETDIQWIKKMLQYVNANPFLAHYTALEMAPGTFRTSVFNPDGTLHATHGQPYFDDETNQTSPSRQTNFTN